MKAERWIRRFQANRERERLDWDAPVELPSGQRVALARSLAVFQLGETGEGTCLRRYGERTRGWAGFEGYEVALDLFVKEENRHAELLAELVGRFGGTLLAKQWSDSIFRFVRKLLHLEFELQILLTAELLAEAYYEVLRRHADDGVLRSACARILRDEAGHTAFHADFFGAVQARWSVPRRWLWQAQFRLLHLVVCAGVWWDHRDCLRALRVPVAEYVGLCRRAVRVFQRRLGRARRRTVRWPVRADEHSGMRARPVDFPRIEAPERL